MSPFGNGMNYFIWGCMAALDRARRLPCLKKIYKGSELPEVGFEYADEAGPTTWRGEPSVAAPEMALVGEPDA